MKFTMLIKAALVCMALNVYYEARNQPVEGQMGVTYVVLNRVKDERFPNKICNVVYQGKHSKITGMPLRNKCMFSWYCDGRGDNPNPGRTWESSKDLAKIVLGKHQQDILIDITDGATHYHANWMESFPRWSAQHKKVASIDRHIFYKARKRHSK